MRMRPLLLAPALLAAFAVAGCHTAPAHRDDDGLGWTEVPPPPPTDGAIYSAGRDMGLIENPVARNVGDILTVVLNEETAAQKTATTTTSKSTNDTLPGMTLLGKAVTLHGVPITTNNIADQTKFDGEGASKQSNSLTGFVTVTVVKVLPNGNLYVRGEKRIGINQGDEYIRLTGVIRPIDLSPDDSISSSKVANARITYSGKGAVADSNAQGWLSRFFNSPWTPF
jgi:flagellar L-ring protein precursor FlgH